MAGSTDKLPLVSIFCMCKDCSQTIKRCVESVLNQDYPNIEFVVQDGASTDGTLEILRAYKEDNDKIKLISEPDSSPSEGLIRALKRCSGDIIGSCLSDEELLPHAASWAVNNFAKHPDVAAIYGDCYLTDLDGNIIRKYLAPEFDIKRFLCREIYPPLSASFFRRVCLNAVGLKDKEWALDCGEAEIWTRLGLKFPIRHMQGIVTKYAWHAGQSSKTIENWNNILIPGTIKLMNRLFDDPGIPDDIRFIREEAFAGFHLWLVQELLASNAVSDAIKQFKTAFQYKPRVQRVKYISGLLFQQGKTLLKEGRAADALSCFDALLAKDITALDMHHLRAVALSRLSKSARINRSCERIECIQQEYLGASKIIRKSERVETQKEAKYLSIVVTVRNDDHGGNMLHRMQVFVNALCHQCKKYNLNAELIIVEWNAPQNKERISQVIEWLNELSPLSVRFIEVPSEIHDQIENADKIPLFQMIAKNVGIRRARGKFVLTTNIDIIFSNELMWFLSRRLLDENSFYRICRYDVGSKIIPTDITVGEQLEFCRNNLVRIQGLSGTKDLNKIETESKLNQRHNEFIRLSDDGIRIFLEKKEKGDKLFTNACGDFTLMSRNKWFSLKCYPELPKWSIYVDGLLLHMAHVSGLSQIILPDPMRIYHIEHDMGWAVIQDTVKERPSLDYQKEYLPWCRKMLREKRPLNPNDENWGLAQYELKEYTVSEPATQTEKIGEKDADTLTSDVFHEWIAKLATAQNRLYYRDQTPESLNDLVKLVDKYKPTKIVELGTLSGLSLRTWLSADTDAEITAIDLSFAPLRQSREIIPVNLSRVKLLEQNILKVDFSQLWGPENRVLLYVDAHDMPNVPIMEYVLQNAVPGLPSGSIVVVDDLWYSPATLRSKTARQFFENTVINEIDPLQCFQGYYAPYWKGGSFFGFREVIPLMEWVNKNQIDLVFKPGIKSVTFEWPQKNSVEAKFYAEAFEQLTGKVNYNPVEKTLIHRDENFPVDQQTFELCKNGAELYAAGNMQESINSFKRASDLNPSLSGVFYAQAVILARAGQLEAASKILQEELNNPYPHPNSQALLEDIRSWTNKQRNSKQGLPQKEQAISIFAMPRPFRDHIDIIQRNAIKSWTLLQPRPEIILLGNEEGTAEIAREFGLCHMPDIKCNEYGTPLINDLFMQAQSIATNDILVYVNADIILMSDFLPAVYKAGSQFPKFLMIGQRWDIDIHAPFDFEPATWENQLRNLVSKSGLLHAVTGIDYFVFSKHLWKDIPPFAIGRTAWDNWLVYQPLAAHLPVVDVTQVVMAVHQNHNYSHLSGGKAEAFQGAEAQRNRELAIECLSKGYIIGFTSHATWQLTQEGLIRRNQLQPVQWPEDALQAKVISLCENGGKLLKTQKPDLALAKFDEALNLKMNQKILGVHYFRALALGQLARFGEAIEALKVELSLQPNHRESSDLLIKLRKVSNDEQINRDCYETTSNYLIKKNKQTIF